jgi:hypothetical protein
VCFLFFSIKGSCGPQSQTCLQYNFALVPGQYTEYVGRTIPITKANIQERSENILEQWGKTGSLYPHNVVCIYVLYYFWVDKIVHYNPIFRFWYHLVTISPILVKESGINSTQITIRLLNTSIGQFGYAKTCKNHLTQRKLLYFVNDELGIFFLGN